MIRPFHHQIFPRKRKNRDFAGKICFHQTVSIQKLPRKWDFYPNLGTFTSGSIISSSDGFRSKTPKKTEFHPNQGTFADDSTISSLDFPEKMEKFACSRRFLVQKFLENGIFARIKGFLPAVRPFHHQIFPRKQKNRDFSGKICWHQAVFGSKVPWKWDFRPNQGTFTNHLTILSSDFPAKTEKSRFRGKNFTQVRQKQPLWSAGKLTTEVALVFGC